MHRFCFGKYTVLPLRKNKQNEHTNKSTKYGNFAHTFPSQHRQLSLLLTLSFVLRIKHIAYLVVKESAVVALPVYISWHDQHRRFLYMSRFLAVLELLGHIECCSCLSSLVTLSCLPHLSEFPRWFLISDSGRYFSRSLSSPRPLPSDAILGGDEAGQ